METPFKFLEAYKKKDRNLFFGRDDEIAELYSLVKKANLVVVYGKSGVGKTSLIRCGLASEIKENEVLMLEISRRTDINESLGKELNNLLKLETAAYRPAADLIERVYNRTLKPIYLLFDQFEELFILGDQQEKRQFLSEIKQIRAREVPCVIVLIIRQEYLGELTVLKKEVPYLFEYTLKVDQMDQNKTVEVVDQIFARLLKDGYTVTGNEQQQLQINYDHAITPHLVDIISGGSFFIELPYLQVYLDKLFTIAYEKQDGKLDFNEDLLTDERVASIEVVINNLLDEQIKKATERTGEDSDVKVLTFLKILVTDNDTKKPVTFLKLHDTAIERGLTDDQVETYLEIFTNALLLRPLEGNQYELSHDSVAAKISLKRSDKKRLIPVIKGNPYKGLTAFTESEEDIKRFFGRSEAIDKVLALIDKQKLIVISGASGTGKSSLVKAGIFPEMSRRGYEKFEIRPGDYPLFPLKKVIASINALPSGKAGYVLLIDQYEELITRSKQEQDAEEFKDMLVQLIENPGRVLTGMNGSQQIKIIVTIRADFEPQFKEGKLEKFWDRGRYVVPYMSARELEQVIENPAELAACYFDPLTLIRNIAEEVSGRPSALPLLSFALSLMYEASLPDRIITKKIYDTIGVFGALQTKANEIFNSFDDAGRKTMREVLLRMVSFEGSEVTSRRVYLQELDYPSAQQNLWVKKVVNTLEKERLIIMRRDENGLDYAEPAHDALLKGWTMLWAWIKDFGKENLYLRGRLAQAVTDYSKNVDSLWANNPWLDTLIPELRAETSWLNRTEADFVEKSKRAREMIQARVAEEIDTAQKMIEQKKSIKRSRSITVGISIALILVLIFGVMAWIERSSATKSLNQVKVTNSMVERLNLDLARNNKYLLDAKNSLSYTNTMISSANDSISSLVEMEKQAVQRAKIAAGEAIEQRKIALRANERLKLSVEETQTARKLAELRGDSLAHKVKREQETNLALNLVKNRLDSTIHILDSFNLTLKGRNTIQLVSRSKSLENTDMVKAYRVSELAYKNDSSIMEVAAQFRRLSDTNAYYYTNTFQGNFSIFSPDGRYILTKWADNKIVSLIENSTYKVLDILHSDADLISVAFSPSAQLVMLTFQNSIEIRRVMELNNRINFPIKVKNIVLTRFSPDEESILIVTNTGWNVRKLNVNTDQDPPEFIKPNKKDENFATAVFSEDGSRVITGSTKGVINIWDALSGRQIYFKMPSANIVSSYISPKGNYFLINTSEDMILYDSRGKQVSLPNLQKRYGQLNSAVFSEDGKRILLSMSSSDTWLSAQQQQQVQQKQYKTDKSESKTILLISLDNPSKSMINLASLIGPDDISSFTAYAHPVIDKQYIFYGFEKNVIKVLDLDRRVKMQLTGRTEVLNSISVFNGYILTSTVDNTSRIWQYAPASALTRTGLMPELSSKDLKELGIVQ